MNSITSDPGQVILAPVVSEKSYGLIAGPVTFRVAKSAHKIQVRQAIEELFNVKVIDVKIVYVPAKPKRRGANVVHAWGLQEGHRRASRWRHHRALRRRALMGVRSFKPTSAGRRFMTVSDFAEITRPSPRRRCSRLPAGRPQQQRSHHDASSGRRHKRRYRIIDFKRRKDGVPAKVASIEYDPNRSARIALLHYANGAKAYILAPQRLEVGTPCMSGPDADIKPGNCLPLIAMPTGTTVHAVELRPGQGAKLVRSAGVSAQLVAKEGDLALPAPAVRRAAPRARRACRATVGVLGNAEHQNESGGKAGRSRWLGRPPASAASR